MEPPMEIPQPPVDPLETIESRLLRSIWQVISSLNDPSMRTVNTLGEIFTMPGPFCIHMNEIFDTFDEYRVQLELMRSNLLEAAREVDAGTRPIIDEFEPRYRGPRHQIQRSMCEEIDHSFDSLRNRIGYESECRLVNENISDDESSLFSSVNESANENESE